MEICIHAGVHKSGTTTVQHTLAATFAKPGVAWYPTSGSFLPTNHGSLVWSLLGHYRDGAHPGAARVLVTEGGGPGLADVVSQAAAHGVDTLLISAEALDRTRPEDAPRLREAFGGHPVHALFTVTAPRHRWVSMWQEHVKHGLGASPARSAPILRDSGLLTVGALEQLVLSFPADRRTVRIVETQPPDEDLARSVARIFGVEWPEDAPLPTNRNVTLGVRAIALAHLNGCGRTAGLMAPESVEALERALAEADNGRIDPYSPADFEIPADIAEVAAAEVDFLERVVADGLVTVVDPSGALATWESRGVPDWYAAAARESTGPGDRWIDLETVSSLRRSTGEWAAAATRHRLVFEELLRLRTAFSAEQEAHARTTRRLRRVRGELASVKSSRTWRLAARVARVAGRG